MDKDLEPQISVIMPVYNGEAYVAEAIESILGQTFTDFEFLVIDNASTDGSATIIKSFNDPRIKVISNPVNLGLIGSLNVGLQAARGKYVARMDHDDIALPERFQKEYDFLETHPEVAIVGTWSRIINSDGVYIKTHRNPLRSNVIKYELLFGNTITHPSIMMRRKEILALGGYDPQWVHTEDYNLYSRAVRKYQLANIGETLLNYRMHGTSLTGSPDSQAIIHGNTKKMIRENISFYLPLSDEDHRLITEVLIARHPNPKLTFHEVLVAHRLHKKIYEAFLLKEGGMLDTQDRHELRGRYTGRRNLLFKKYLVGKYHLITRAHA